MPSAPIQAAAVSGPLYPLVPPNPENGAAIYAEKCAPCHGDSGMGDGPRAAQLPNPVAAIGALDVARAATPAGWYTQVTQGNLEKFMPPFNSLSDRERWDVVAYAFSLSAPLEAVQQGSQLFQENCARCHGPLGQGDGPDAAVLANPPADLTNQEYIASKSEADYFNSISEGSAPDMPAFAADLGEGQRWTLSAFLRSLSTEGGAPPKSSQAAATLTTPPAAEAQTTQPAATQVISGTTLIGTISGLVTSAGGEKLPEDLQVTLNGYDNMTVVVTQTTTIQADGVYVFSNVEMPAGRVFMSTLEYKQASYGSDLGMVEDGISKIDLPITIYETTTDASILKADRLHLFFEFVDAQTVRVIELYIVSNPTDKTLVAESEGQPTIRFNLPEGATNLEFQDGVLGGRYVELPGGFGDTIAIRPGSGGYESLYAYLMPYDKSLDLKLVMPMPVDAVVILVPEGDITIKSDALIDGGSRDVQGTQYHSYSGNSLTTGQELNMTVTGRPTSSGAPGLAQSSSTGLVIGLSAFGAAMLLAGVWLYRRTRQPSDVDEEDLETAPAASASSMESVETITDAILALDDLYQAGQLPEEAYRQRRADLKARLRELMNK